MKKAVKIEQPVEPPPYKRSASGQLYKWIGGMYAGYTPVYEI